MCRRRLAAAAMLAGAAVLVSPHRGLAQGRGHPFLAWQPASDVSGTHPLPSAVSVTASVRRTHVREGTIIGAVVVGALEAYAGRQLCLHYSSTPDDD